MTQLPNPQSRVLTVSQAAKFLNVSIDTLRRWDKKSKLIPIRTAGGSRRYRRDQLEAFKLSGNASSDLSQMLTIKEAAQKFGVSAITLRRWDKSGKIKFVRDESNYRRISISEIKKFLGQEQQQEQVNGLSGYQVEKVEQNEQAGRLTGWQANQINVQIAKFALYAFAVASLVFFVTGIQLKATPWGKEFMSSLQGGVKNLSNVNQSASDQILGDEESAPSSYSLLPTAYSPNLLKNPSFETNPPAGGLAFWQLHPNSTNDNTQMSNAASHSGSYSLLVTADTGGVIQESTKTEAKRNYTLGVWVKVEGYRNLEESRGSYGGKPSLHLALGPGWDKSFPIVSDGNWHWYSTSFDSPPPGLVPRIYVNVERRTLNVDQRTTDNAQRTANNGLFLFLDDAVFSEAESFAGVKSKEYGVNDQLASSYSLLPTAYSFQTLLPSGGNVMSISAQGIIYPNDSTQTQGGLGLESSRIGKVWGSNIDISQSLSVNEKIDIAGKLTANGNITLGNNDGDEIEVGGRFISDLLPKQSNAVSIGTSTQRWNNLFAAAGNISNNLAIGGNTTMTGSLTISGGMTLSGGSGLSVTGDLSLDGDLDFQGPQNITTTSDNLTISPTGNLVIDTSGGSVIVRDASIDLTGQPTTISANTLSVVSSGTLALDTSSGNNQIRMTTGTGTISVSSGAFTAGVASYTLNASSGAITLRSSVDDINAILFQSTAGGIQLSTGSTDNGAIRLLSSGTITLETSQNNNNITVQTGTADFNVNNNQLVVDGNGSLTLAPGNSQVTVTGNVDVSSGLDVTGTTTLGDGGTTNYLSISNTGDLTMNGTANNIIANNDLVIRAGNSVTIDTSANNTDLRLRGGLGELRGDYGTIILAAANSLTLDTSASNNNLVIRTGSGTFDVSAGSYTLTTSSYTQTTNGNTTITQTGNVNRTVAGNITDRITGANNYVLRVGDAASDSNANGNDIFLAAVDQIVLKSASFSQTTSGNTETIVSAGDYSVLVQGNNDLYLRGGGAGRNDATDGGDLQLAAQDSMILDAGDIAITASEDSTYPLIIKSSAGGIQLSTQSTDNGNLTLYSAGTLTLDSSRNNTNVLILPGSGRIGIGTTSPATTFHINTTDGIIIPVGTTAQRAGTPTTGTIRYNNTTSQFEGYGSTAWGSLGGVIDVDQNTYVSAEDSPGANNDDLKFITAGTQRMIIDETGNTGIGPGPGSAVPAGILDVAGNAPIILRAGQAALNNSTSGSTSTTADLQLAAADQLLAAAGTLTFLASNDSSYPLVLRSSQGGIQLSTQSRDNGNILISSAGNLYIDTSFYGTTTYIQGGLVRVGDSGANTTATGADDLYIEGDFEVDGNVSLGASSASTLSVGSYVTSNLVPDPGSTYDLGSNTRKWLNLYADTVTANNISGTVITGSTSAANWTIDVSNATADLEDSTVTFERGTEVTNSEIRWNSSGDRYFSTNASFQISPDTGIGIPFRPEQPILTVNDSYGGRRILTLRERGSDILNVDSSGNILLSQASNIETSSGALTLRGYSGLTLTTSSATTGEIRVLSRGTLQLDTSTNNTNILVRAGTGNVNVSSTQLYLTGNLVVTGTETFNGVTYTFPGADGSASNVLTTSGTGLLSWGTIGAASITADSLDFTEFKDEMTLDADTTVNGDYSLVLRTGLGAIQNSTSGSNDLQLSAEDKLILAGASFDLSTSNGAVDIISNQRLDLSSGGTLTLDTSANNSNILLKTGSGNINVSTGTLTMTGVLDVRDSTGTLALATDSNGNVGIGTTSPLAMLHVAGECVSEGTLIRRRRRRRQKGELEWEDVPVEDIEPGDEVLTLDETTGRFVWQTVESTMDKGIQAVFELATEDGKRIETTAEHPYLVRQTFGGVELNRDENQGAGNQNQSGGDLGRSHDVPEILSGHFDDLSDINANNKNSVPKKTDLVKARILLRSDHNPNAGDTKINPYQAADKLPQIPETTRNKEILSLLANEKLIPLNLSSSCQSVKWIKVNNLKIGMEIATVNGWQKIISIKQVGRKQVYDLEIEATHNFVANGIVAHNTTGILMRAGASSLQLSSSATSTTADIELAAADQIDLFAGRFSLTTSSSTAGDVKIDSAGTLTLSTSRNNTNIKLMSGTGNIQVSSNQLYLTGNLVVTGTETLNGIAYTFPGADTSNGVLISNGSGLLSWNTIGQSNVTNDSLDFAQFDDSLDLDADTSINGPYSFIVRAGAGSRESGVSGNNDLQLSAADQILIDSAGLTLSTSNGDATFRAAGDNDLVLRAGDGATDSTANNNDIFLAAEDAITLRSATYSLQTSGSTITMTALNSGITLSTGSDTKGTISLQSAGSLKIDTSKNNTNILIDSGTGDLLTNVGTNTLSAIDDTVSAIGLSATRGGITLSSSSANGNGDIRILSGGTLRLSTSANNSNILLQAGSGNINLSSTGTITLTGNTSLNNGTLKLNGLTYTFPGSDTANGVLISNGSGVLSWNTIGAANVTADSLDFSEFKDEMTLDADTTVNGDQSLVIRTGLGSIQNSTSGSNDLQLSAEDKLILAGASFDLSTSSGTVDIISNQRLDLSSGGTLTLDTSQNNANIVLTPGTGNIGIGSTAPVYKLDVNGTLRTSSTARVEGALTVTTGGASVTGDLTLDGDLDFTGAQNITTTADNLTISPNGNLVIDTSGGTVSIRDAAIDLTNQPTTISGSSLTLRATGNFILDTSANNTNLVLQGGTGGLTGSFGTANLTAVTDSVSAVYLNAQRGGITLSSSNASGNGPVRILSGGSLQLSTSQGNQPIYLQAGTGNVNVSSNQLYLTGNLVVTGTETFNGRSYTFPGSETASGVLLTDGSGVLSWTTIGQASVTADSLDFTEFKDEMTLDADTSINGDQSLILRVGRGALQDSTSGNNDLQLSAEDKLILGAASFDLLTSSGGVDITARGRVDLSTGGTLTLDTSQNNTNIVLTPGTGNVGIGSTAPAYKLDVNGTLRTSSTARIEGALTVTTGGASVTGDLTLDGDLDFTGAQNITTTADNLTLSPTGNLIIDTSGGTLSIRDAGIDLTNQPTTISGSSLTLRSTGNFILDTSANNTNLVLQGGTGGLTGSFGTINLTAVNDSVSAVYLNAQRGGITLSSSNAAGNGPIRILSGGSLQLSTSQGNQPIYLQAGTGGINLSSGTTTISGNVNLNSGTLTLNGVAYTFPGADSANGVLISNGSGLLSWNTIGQSNVTNDSLDFAQFQDELDLDADTSINGDYSLIVRSGLGAIQNSTSGSNDLQLSAEDKLILAGASFDLSTSNGAVDIISNQRLDLSSGGTLTLDTSQNNANIVLTPGTGNVGIGSTAPVYKLDVNGTLRTSSTARIEGALTVTTGGASVTGDLTLDGDLDFTGAQNITTTADNLTISPTGNLVLDTSGGTISIRDSSLDLTSQPTTLSASSLTLRSTGNFILDTSANNTNLVLQGGTGGLTGSFGTVNLTAVTDSVSAVYLNAQRGGITLSSSNASGNGPIRILSGGSLQLSTSQGNQPIYLQAGTGNLNVSSNQLYLTGNLVVTGTETLNGIAYTFPGADTANGVLISNGSGLLSWNTIGAANVTADSLDFTEFKDEMTLDADTSINGDYSLIVRAGLGARQNATSGSNDLQLAAEDAMIVDADDFTLTTSNTGVSSMQLISKGTFRIDTSTNNANILLLPGSGNVGIGTTGPTASNLVVYNSAAASAGGASVLTLRAAAASATIGSGPYLSFSNDTELGRVASVADAASSQGMAFSTYNSGLGERVRITGSGNVGLGTTSPAGILDILGQCVTGDTLLKRRRRRRRRGKNGEWLEEDYFEDVRIDQIKEGDEILTLDQQRGAFVVSKVNKLMDKGTKPIWQLATASGKTIRTTGSHPYYASAGADNGRVGVFIDAANLEVSLRSLGVNARYGKLEELLGGNVVLKRYYSVDFNDEPQKRLFTFLKTHRFKLVTKPIKTIRRRGSQGKKTKANFDVEISIDAFKMTRDYDTLVLFSGDSDFVYMVSQLQKLGKKIIVVSPNFRTATELRAAADLFIDLRNFKEMFTGNKKGPLWAFNNNLSTAESILTQLAPFVKSGRGRRIGGKWTKVNQLKAGHLIATSGDNGKPIMEKVISIKKLPAEQVYDIEVEGTHNFVGNGIVAHNTTGILMRAGASSLQLSSSATSTTADIELAAADRIDMFASSFNLTTSNTSDGSLKLTSYGNLTLDTSQNNGNIIFNTGTGGITQNLGTYTVNATTDQIGAIALNATRGGITLSSSMASSNGNIYLKSAGTLQLDTSAKNANILLMPGTGNVGIGTTGPAYKLDVNGGINSLTGTINLRQNLTDLAGRRNWRLANEVSTVGDFQIQESSANNTEGSVARLTILSGGNLGIGTTGPSTNLQVSGNSALVSLGGTGTGLTLTYGGLWFQNTQSGTNFALAQANSSSLYFNVPSSSEDFIFENGGSTRVMQVYGSGNIGIGGVNAGTSPNLWIASTGNVGIGTTGPGYKLEVSGGDIYGSQDIIAARDLKLGNGRYIAEGGTNIIDTDYGGTDTYIRALSRGMIIDGNVGIGTTSPQGILDVLGSCVTGDTLLPIRRRRRKKKYADSDDPLPTLPDVEGEVPADAFEFEHLLCRIDQVLPGDEVLSLNEATGALEYSRINTLKDMGVKEVYELTTKSGRVIRTTAEHPYLVEIINDGGNI